MKVSHLNAKPLKCKIFIFGLRGAQQYTDMQLLVQCLFKLVKRLKLSSVRERGGVGSIMPFLSNAVLAQPLNPSIVCMSKYSFWRVNLRFEPRAMPTGRPSSNLIYTIFEKKVLAKTGGVFKFF